MLRKYSSYTMCHLSPVTCHLSPFFLFFFILKKIDKLVELVGGGSVITGPTPSSFFPQKGNIPFCIQPCKALTEIFPSHENFSNNESRYPPSSLWNTWVFLLQYNAANEALNSLSPASFWKVAVIHISIPLTP